MPSTVRLRIGSFCENVPKSAWRGSQKDRERVIELRCEDVFETNAPRIHLAKLAKLAPAYFDASLEPDVRIALPAAALALEYQPATHREVIGESDFPMAPSPEGGSETGGVPGSEFGVGKPAIVHEEREPATPGTATGPATDQAQNGDWSEADGQATARIAPPAFPRTGASSFAGVLHRQQRLQELLLTDEDLTLPKVLEGIANLPGIEACVIALEERVIASTISPADLDLRTLGEHANRFLEHCRGLPLRAELGLSDALTMYAERGPFSFLREGRLCLTVVHRGKGFVPGVREKLACVLKALAEQVGEDTTGPHDASISIEQRDEAPL